MDLNLKRIIKLIQKTGDRFIVSDSSLGTPYVVMPLADYEKLVTVEAEEDVVETETTEGQLLEKINHDIAVWKSQQEKISETLDSFRSDTNKNEITATVEETKNAPEEDKGDVEDQYYFEPLES